MWKCRKCGEDVLAYCTTSGYISAGITSYKEPDDWDVREIRKGLDLFDFGCSNECCQNSSENLEEIAYWEE